MLKPICRFTGRHPLLDEDQIEDLRLAASKLKGAERRAFDQGVEADTVKRLSMDCKATVEIGEFSRGGRTRGDH